MPTHYSTAGPALRAAGARPVHPDALAADVDDLRRVLERLLEPLEHAARIALGEPAHQSPDTPVAALDDVRAHDVRNLLLLLARTADTALQGYAHIGAWATARGHAGADALEQAAHAANDARWALHEAARALPGAFAEPTPPARPHTAQARAHDPQTARASANTPGSRP